MLRTSFIQEFYGRRPDRLPVLDLHADLHTGCQQVRHHVIGTLEVLYNHIERRRIVLGKDSILVLGCRIGRCRRRVHLTDQVELRTGIDDTIIAYKLLITSVLEFQDDLHVPLLIVLENKGIRTPLIGRIAQTVIIIRITASACGYLLGLDLTVEDKKLLVCHGLHLLFSRRPGLRPR